MLTRKYCVKNNIDLQSNTRNLWKWFQHLQEGSAVVSQVSISKEIELKQPYNQIRHPFLTIMNYAIYSFVMATLLKVKNWHHQNVTQRIVYIEREKMWLDQAEWVGFWKYWFLDTSNYCMQLCLHFIMYKIECNFVTKSHTDMGLSFPESSTYPLCNNI